jgi:hypothetical protein
MLLFSCSFKPNLQLVFLRRAQQNRDLPFWNDINLKPSNSVGVFFSRRKYRIGGKPYEFRDGPELASVGVFVHEIPARVCSITGNLLVPE